MKELPQITKQPLRHVDLVRYAGASGDFNEIHTVTHAAKENGFKDVIAHGMFVMGWVSQAVEAWFPEHTLAFFNVRFSAVTYPNETLTIKGRWDESTGIGEVVVTDAAGTIKLKGKIRLQPK